MSVSESNRLTSGPSSNAAHAVEMGETFDVEIVAILRKRRVLEAIQLVCQHKGMSLTEALAYVNELNRSYNLSL